MAHKVADHKTCDHPDCDDSGQRRHLISESTNSSPGAATWLKESLLGLVSRKLLGSSSSPVHERAGNLRSQQNAARETELKVVSDEEWFVSEDVDSPNMSSTVTAGEQKDNVASNSFRKRTGSSNKTHLSSSIPPIGHKSSSTFGKSTKSSGTSSPGPGLSSFQRKLSGRGSKLTSLEVQNGGTQQRSISPVPSRVRNASPTRQGGENSQASSRNTSPTRGGTGGRTGTRNPSPTREGGNSRAGPRNPSPTRGSSRNGPRNLSPIRKGSGSSRSGPRNPSPTRGDSGNSRSGPRNPSPTRKGSGSSRNGLRNLSPTRGESGSSRNGPRNLSPTRGESGSSRNGPRNLSPTRVASGSSRNGPRSTSPVRGSTGGGGGGGSTRTGHRNMSPTRGGSTRSSSRSTSPTRGGAGLGVQISAPVTNSPRPSIKRKGILVNNTEPQASNHVTGSDSQPGSHCNGHRTNTAQANGKATPPINSGAIPSIKLSENLDSQEKNEASSSSAFEQVKDTLQIRRPKKKKKGKLSYSIVVDPAPLSPEIHLDNSEGKYHDPFETSYTENGELEQKVEHDFKPASIPHNKPEYCDQCGDTAWGLYRQVLKCTSEFKLITVESLYSNTLK